MPMSVERLPVELWLTVFSFLDGYELQRAFWHINSFFTGLLHSNCLRIYLNITRGGCKEISAARRAFSNQAFEILHANIHGSSDLLIFLDTTNALSNLGSLSLHLRRQKNYGLLISNLPRLSQLQYLKVSYRISSADPMLESLYTEIFRLPQLLICELQLSQNWPFLPERYPDLPTSSSLRRFSIDAAIRSSEVYHLLKFMPSLRALNVYLYHHNRSSWNDLSLPELTKAKWLSLISGHIDLNRLVQDATHLTRFHLQIEPYNGQCTREYLESTGFLVFE